MSDESLKFPGPEPKKPDVKLLHEQRVFNALVDGKIQTIIERKVDGGNPDGFGIYHVVVRRIKDQRGAEGEYSFDAASPRDAFEKLPQVLDQATKELDAELAKSLIEVPGGMGPKPKPLTKIDVEGLVN